jgi:type VI secretion system protein ImpE
MMNASTLYKAGQLQAAIDEQIKEVKAAPADKAKRLFLFELLAFAGDLDRARRQIEAVTYEELELEAQVLDYKKLLDAEQRRRQLFSDGLKPEFFTEPPAHVQLRLEAVNHLRANNQTEAAALLEQAHAQCPPLKGQLNDKPFEALRDCDDLFADVLEVLARGTYFWVPLEQVARLTMNPPKFPRDLLWVSGRLEMTDSAAGNVFFPALYPRSHEHPDNQIKLGRMTDWQGPDSGPVLGVGLRTFLAGDDPFTLLQWRQLEIHETTPAA